MNFLATNFPKTCTVVLVTSNSINDITSVMDTVDMISDVMKQTPLAIFVMQESSTFPAIPRHAMTPPLVKYLVPDHMHNKEKLNSITDTGRGARDPRLPL